MYLKCVLSLLLHYTVVPYFTLLSHSVPPPTLLSKKSLRKFIGRSTTARPIVLQFRRHVTAGGHPFDVVKQKVTHQQQLHALREDYKMTHVRTAWRGIEFVVQFSVGGNPKHQMNQASQPQTGQDVADPPPLVRVLALFRRLFQIFDKHDDLRQNRGRFQGQRKRPSHVGQHVGI